MLVYQTYTIYMNEKCVYGTAVFLLRREGKKWNTHFSNLWGFWWPQRQRRQELFSQGTEFHMIPFLHKLLHCLINDYLDLWEFMDNEYAFFHYFNWALQHFWLIWFFFIQNCYLILKKWCQYFETPNNVWVCVESQLQSTPAALLYVLCWSV